MSRTRVRWKNLAKLAGGLGLGALVIGLGPRLLEPPEPEPLPDDLGLATGATGLYASTSVNGEAEPSPSPRAPRRQPRTDRERSGHPVADPGGRPKVRAAAPGQRPTPARGERPRRLTPIATVPSARATAPLPPAPALGPPAPATTAAAPPPPAAPDRPEPAPSSYKPAPEPRPAGSSQFAFEH